MNPNAGRILITGCSGSGKSTRQNEMAAERKRIIALDPKGTSFRKGYKSCRSLAAVYQAVKDGWHTGFKIQIPTGLEIDNCLSIITQLVPALFTIQQPYLERQRGMADKKISLFVDEADLFFPNKFAEAAVQTQIDHLTRRGREYGIEVVAATQRIAQVATTLRGNCTELYILAQVDHNDISAILKMIGRDQAAALRNLKAHEYLHKSMEIGGSIRKGKNTSSFVK